MLRTVRRICSVGLVSETAPEPDELLRVGAALEQRARSVLGRALCIRHVDAGSCNGCELEIQALNNPLYNLEGLGIRGESGVRPGSERACRGRVSNIIPVDVAIPGCPPSPVRIMQGILAAVGGRGADALPRKPK